MVYILYTFTFSMRRLLLHLFHWPLLLLLCKQQLWKLKERKTGDMFIHAVLHTVISLKTSGKLHFKSRNYSYTLLLVLLPNECMNCFVAISVWISGDIKSLPVLPPDFWSPLLIRLSHFLLYQKWHHHFQLHQKWCLWDNFALRNVSGKIWNESNDAICCCQTGEENFRRTEEPRRSL